VRKIVFTPDQLTGSEVGKKIGWFLLAWVLIQASWFMMGALLDIEKITTSAMGALPGLVIQDDNSRWQKMVGAMWTSGILWKKLELKETSTNPKHIDYVISNPDIVINTWADSILDSILPSHNTLSWPLYFIWFAIFKFQWYSEVHIDQSLNLKDLSWIVTGTGIKFLVLAAFVIMMLLLFVINIIRVAYLWMVIALAPIIVLYLVLKDVLGMEIWSAQEGIMSKINIKTILAYVFQPTIIITFMGLMLIAVTALWQEMGPGVTEIEEYGFTISNTGVSHASFELETQWELFGNVGEVSRWVFKDLIILWLVFALLIGIIVLSAGSLQIKFIENIASSIWPALMKVPFMPVFSMWWAANKIFKDTTGINLIWQNAGKLDITGHNALNEWFGEAPIGWIQDDKYINELKSNIARPKEYIQSLQKYRDSKWEKWLSMNAQWLLPSLAQFIRNNHEKEQFRELRLSTLDKTKLTPDQQKDFTTADLLDYLEYEDNANNLYKAIMGNLPTTSNTITARAISEWRLNLKKPATPKKDTPPG